MKRSHFQRQRGLTMLMVLLLMAAMLMGALAFARITEVGSLVSGNLASKDSSFHAAEVGRGYAFAALQALPNRDADSGGWYWAKQQPTNPDTGIPTTIDFAATPQVPGNVGRFTVTYAVERLCNTAGEIKDSARYCIVLNPPPGDADPPDKNFESKDYMTVGARQYRITVRVTDARNTQTWTQWLVTVD